MRLGVFEDDRVRQLDPLTLTRPAWDLWCGAGPLVERHCRHLGATEMAFFVRPSLAGWYRFLRPGHAVNDPDWLGAGGTALLVNGRWLPPADPAGAKLSAPVMGMVDRQVAYAFVPAADCQGVSPDELPTRVEGWVRSFPRTQAGGVMIDRPWDLVEHNALALTEDLARFHASAGRPVDEAGPVVIGPRDRVHIDPGAEVESPVVVDTTRGPVIIDCRAVVRAFSRIEGPCYIGPGSQVLGATVKGSTLGPHCRVGGEVEVSILQGYVNKQHDGFLGHSYVGEWVNLASGTQVSDLRNDYGEVRVTVSGEAVDTGLMKVGAFLGDHVRTGVGTLLNCGTSVGPFAQLLPCGSYLPRSVPSFCTLRQGKAQECPHFGELFTAAATAMARRGQVWRAEHAEFFITLYETTTQARRETLRRQESNGQEPAGGCGRLTLRRCF